MVKNVILTILAATIICFSEEKFEISASISKSKIYENEIITLSLSVSGADKDIFKNIQKPNLSSMFTTVSTSQSSSFSYVNGVANRNRQYNYSLRPMKSGIFIIDPFTIVYNGKKYSTKPLRVVVRDGNTSSPAQGISRQQLSTIRSRPSRQTKNIFIETHISTNNIYLGESIEYSIKFYRRISLWSSISIDQEDMTGVWQNALPIAPERVVRKNGQRYYELELIKKTIRPLNVGALTIPPLIARFVVDPFSGEYQLASEPITINVSELPEPVPDSFTGAIGSYTMSVSSPNLNVDSNAIQIQLTIQGTGNIEAILPPVIQDTAQYRVLSAPKTDESSNINRQIFDYVIIPKITGELTIPSIEFSYFSKEDMNYVTLSANPVTFNAILENLSTKESSFSVQEDIQFLKNNSIINKIMAVFNDPWTGLLFSGINGVLILIFIYNYLNSKQFFSKTSKQKTRKKLMRHIHGLSEGTSINEMEKILVDVLNYFTDYDHHAIHPKEVELSLVRAELSDPIVKGTMQWIKNSQILRFSQEKPSDSNHSNSESLKRILNHIITEKEAK
jgi:hypothetical protein